MNLGSGTTVEHFVLQRQIGAGGMGTVWAARDTRSGSVSALKIMRQHDSLAADTLRARLLREAHATRAISHPAIVPVEDVLEHEGCPVLVMQLLQGETLRGRLLRQASLPVPETAGLLLPIAEALGAAHAVGIVHRDLKPENIFIEAGAQPRVRLLDFGVARFYEPPPNSGVTPLTDLGTLIGTLAYMAPEQALHPSECDHLVDVWALGIILYESLSGYRPIEGNNGPDTMRQLLVGGIAPLKASVAGLPEALTNLVDAMLSRSPQRRPRNLTDVATELRRHLTHVPEAR